jgi:hypothetical protein
MYCSTKPVGGSGEHTLEQSTLTGSPIEERSYRIVCLAQVYVVCESE